MQGFEFHLRKYLWNKSTYCSAPNLVYFGLTMTVIIIKNLNQTVHQMFATTISAKRILFFINSFINLILIPQHYNFILSSWYILVYIMNWELQRNILITVNIREMNVPRIQLFSDLYNNSYNYLDSIVIYLKILFFFVQMFKNFFESKSVKWLNSDKRLKVLRIIIFFFTL